MVFMSLLILLDEEPGPAAPVGPPFCVDADDFYVPGSTAGEVFLPGTAAGQLAAVGAVIGEVGC